MRDAKENLDAGAVVRVPRRSAMRPLRIVRMRRDYNRWAADQSLEDYALRFTARSARAATPLRAALTALGSISFLALEAIDHGVVPSCPVSARKIPQAPLDTPCATSPVPQSRKRKAERRDRTRGDTGARQQPVSRDFIFRTKIFTMPLDPAARGL